MVIDGALLVHGGLGVQELQIMRAQPDAGWLDKPASDGTPPIRQSRVQSGDGLSRTDLNKIEQGKCIDHICTVMHWLRMAIVHSSLQLLPSISWVYFNNAE